MWLNVAFLNVARVLDVKHGRSPLVQRGLEIQMLKQTDENKEAIIIYETLVNEHYKEPVDRD